jgi:hypothetical protein
MIFHGVLKVIGGLDPSVHACKLTKTSFDVDDPLLALIVVDAIRVGEEENLTSSASLAENVRRVALHRRLCGRDRWLPDIS